MDCHERAALLAEKKFELGGKDAPGRIREQATAGACAPTQCVETLLACAEPGIVLQVRPDDADRAVALAGATVIWMWLRR